jgi:hypothetical protein
MYKLSNRVGMESWQIAKIIESSHHDQESVKKARLHEAMDMLGPLLLE